MSSRTRLMNRKAEFNKLRELLGQISCEKRICGMNLQESWHLWEHTCNRKPGAPVTLKEEQQQGCPQLGKTVDYGLDVGK